MGAKPKAGRLPPHLPSCGAQGLEPFWGAPKRLLGPHTQRVVMPALVGSVAGPFLPEAGRALCLLCYLHLLSAGMGKVVRQLLQGGPEPTLCPEGQLPSCEVDSPGSLSGEFLRV